MSALLLEWGSLIIRWLHVITGMAWIGASFFFMHLDASLRRDPDIAEGKGGQAWQVHGGGFYQMRKFFVAPAHLPEEITWHKWQSYWTWTSGFVLLIWVYYAQASLYLIDPAVMALAPWQAALIGILSLALGWGVYDGLCRLFYGRSELVLALLGFGFVVLMSLVYARLFSGRGAIIHTGALMATMMTGNVAMVIMPNQRKVIAMLTRGEAPDAKYGKIAKTRSAHNNYITLPVVFLMLSNHTPMVWANAAVIPVIVALVIVAGAVIRHFYNARHADHAHSPWWAWGVAAAALIAAFYVSAISTPAGRERLGLAEAASPPALPPAQVADILTSRCSMCHAEVPVWDGIAHAPKGVRLDTPAEMARQREAIRVQAVLSHAMPPNNLTELPPDERKVLAEWLR